MNAATIQLSAPATLAGVRDLRRQIEDVEREFFTLRPSARAATAPDHDAVTLYKRTARDSRSRELLEVLPGGQAHARTPEELAQLMRPDAKTNKPLARGSVRGAIRVVQKVQTKALKEGAIGGEILKIDFGGYAQERAGRYYVEPDARQALDQYLKP